MQTLGVACSRAGDLGTREAGRRRAGPLSWPVCGPCSRPPTSRRGDGISAALAPGLGSFHHGSRRDWILTASD